MRHCTLIGLSGLLLAACQTAAPPPDNSGRVAALEFQARSLSTDSSNQAARVASLESQVAALRAQQLRSECILRVHTATTACLALSVGEQSGPALLHRIDACMRDRGFPIGEKSCG